MCSIMQLVLLQGGLQLLRAQPSSPFPFLPPLAQQVGKCSWKQPSNKTRTQPTCNMHTASKYGQLAWAKSCLGQLATPARTPQDEHMSNMSMSTVQGARPMLFQSLCALGTPFKVQCHQEKKGVQAPRPDCINQVGCFLYLPSCCATPLGS